MLAPVPGRELEVGVTITQFRGGTSLGARRVLALGMVAAVSCGLTISFLGCEDARKKTVVVRPAPELDSGTETGASMLADGSVPAEGAVPERCLVNSEYLAGHKRCSVDAECAPFTYQSTCCPEAEKTLVSIAAADAEEVQACADSIKVVCACHDGLTRAEDGRVVTDSSPAIVRCVQDKCVSSIGPRSCGSRTTCGAHEICVTYENVPGSAPPDPDSPDNSYLTYKCVPNPCQDQLDCGCVQPICDARNDVPRKCEIKRNAESDATCSAVRE